MGRKLTAKQEAFVDAKLSGMSDLGAAKIAGYSDNKISGTQVARSERVQSVLDEARQALANVTNIRKQDVLEGILSAVDRAKMLGEPATEIRGWTEIGKMLGYYAPEVKRIEISDVNRLKGKLEALSDEELFEIANRPPLEGDYEVMN